MSTWPSTGSSAGLDTASLIRQLMQVEAIPKQRLQISANQQASDIKAFQSLRDRAQEAQRRRAHRRQARDLERGDRDHHRRGSHRAARPGAPAGTYDIAVTRLATATTWTTDTADSLDAVIVPSAAIDVTRATAPP